MQVTPRRIRRSPSWSALDEIVFGRHTPHKEDQAFVFMLKVCILSCFLCAVASSACCGSVSVHHSHALHVKT